MKTATLKSKLIGIFILFLSSIYLMTSCNGQNGSSGRGKPKVDIHTAIITDNMDAFQQYIKSGKSLNEREPMNGSTPLITAAVFGKAEMVDMLITAKADINMQNNDGSTALHSAAFFCRIPIVKLLLAKGADRSIKNKYGQTAYQIVAGPYTEVKEIYQGLGAMLEPAGLKLDFAYIEKTRPQVAFLLN